jgi:hypothetical protein
MDEEHGEVMHSEAELREMFKKLGARFEELCVTVFTRGRMASEDGVDGEFVPRSDGTK